MTSFNHISGAEPSTVTFKLATVTQTRNSSVMHQEIMALGDPNSSAAIAECSSSVPTSTFVGLVTKEAGGFLSSLGGIVQIQGNSTVFQGGAPWSVAQVAGSTWSVRAQNSSAGDLLAQISGNCTVAPLAGSTWNARVLQSSAADLQATVTQASTTWAVQLTQYSTIVAVSSLGGVVNVQQNSTVWQVQVGGYSTIVAVSSVGGIVTIAGNSTVAPLAGSTWATRPIQSSQADLRMTAYQSTAADLNVTVAGYSTIVAVSSLGGTVSVANISPMSSVAPSSGSSGIVVRQVIDGIATFASTSALATTSASVVSSVANIRAYVVAYTITSTNQTPAQWGFFTSNATLLWPMTLAAMSSAVTGVNLAVSAPAYLFRTAVGEALNFKTAGSTVSGVQMGVSYFQAP